MFTESRRSSWWNHYFI